MGVNEQSSIDARFSTLRLRIAEELRAGLDPDRWKPNQLTRIQFVLDDMIGKVCGAHDWGWLHPICDDFVLWPATTGITSGAPSYSADTGLSTITATAAAFYDSMVGRAFSFDASSTEYTIAGVTSTTVLTVSGDASGETSGDTYAIACTGDYLLPTDFGALIGGEITFVSSTQCFSPITETTEGNVRRKRALNISHTGIPTHAATRFRSPTDTAGQRQELSVYPIPDQAYTVEFPYELFINQMEHNNYPPGGQRFAKLWIDAALACAELSYQEGNPGVRMAAYERTLADMIQKDLKQKRGVIPGFRGRRNDSRWVRSLRTTVEGVEY